MKPPIIKVENMEQKIILLYEMRGQISDGMWENSRPFNHYKPWMRLDEKSVVVDPEDPGIHGNYYFAKRNYNFANKDLLDIVGERLIVKIGLYRKYGQKILDILAKDSWLIPDSFQYWKHMENANEGYWKDKLKRLNEVGITKEMIQDLIDNPVYTRKDLNRDCKGLKAAFKKTYMEEV